MDKFYSREKTPKVESLSQAIIDLKYNEIGSIVENALNTGLKPLEILDELKVGLKVIGDKYQNGEFFLSELFIAAETMGMAMNVLQPLLLKEKRRESEGTIVLGSIEGDIHDFGKMIISSLLLAAGFNVVDLGIDVPAEKFVDEAEKAGADIIGISALLSTTQLMSKKVIDELEVRKIRRKYKVILGGTGVIPEIAIEKFGVDAAVNDGAKGLDIIKSWMAESRRHK